MSDLQLAAASLNTLAREIHGLAKEKGWYEAERSIEAHVALLHSEVSELFEHYRTHGPQLSLYYQAHGKPEGIPVELADVIIRALDMAADLNINISEAVYRKFLYNTTRGHRHGGKHA